MSSWSEPSSRPTLDAQALMLALEDEAGVNLPLRTIVLSRAQIAAIDPDRWFGPGRWEQFESGPTGMTFRERKRVRLMEAIGEGCWRACQGLIR